MDAATHHPSHNAQPVQISYASAVKMERARVVSAVLRHARTTFKKKLPQKTSAELEKFLRLVAGRMVHQVYQGNQHPELRTSACYELASRSWYHLKDPTSKLQALSRALVQLGILSRVRRGRCDNFLRLEIWPSFELPYLVEISTPQSPVEPTQGPKPDIPYDPVLNAVLDSVGADSLEPAADDTAEIAAAKSTARLNRLIGPRDDSDPEVLKQPMDLAWLLTLAPDLVRTTPDARFWQVSKLTKGNVAAVVGSVRRQVARGRNYRPPSALLHGAALRHSLGAPVASKAWAS